MDDPADLSSQNGSGRHLLDEGSPTRNRKVVGSNPTPGSKKPPGRRPSPSRLVRRAGPATAGKTARVAAP
jgi:hypothetical protein